MTIYPTAVIDALRHRSTVTYDLDTGRVASTTDPNNQTTRFTYGPGGRPTDILRPDLLVGTGVHGEDTYCYNVPSSAGGMQTIPSGSPAGSALSLVRKSRQDANRWNAVELDYDGLGRNIDVAKQYACPGNAAMHMSTAYDGMDQVLTSSNPYCGSSPAAADRTLFTYDALGRRLSAIHGDGSGTHQWTFSGLDTVETDESSRTWKRRSDGRGRLTDVYEPTDANVANPTLQTHYTYDDLNNLTSTMQYGTANESPRTRSFTYDSLSRLLTSSNPETRTICYGLWSGSNCVNGYDANGNLLAKTDARGAVTSYTYDAFNRMTSKSLNGTTVSLYTYDGADHSPQDSRMFGQNRIGRLSAIQTFNPDVVSGCDPAGAKQCDTQEFGYDAMGRLNHMADSSISEWGNTFHTTEAQYDLAGNPTQYQYPDGLQVKHSYDAAGRLLRVTGANPSDTYVSSMTYHPNGSPASVTYGNGVT